MHILLTNDDGFFAPGIQTLYEVLANSSEHTFSIVAPEGQRSATGHSITLFDPLFVTQHSVQDKKTQGFSVRGTPSDCVKLAIQGNLIPKPDLIISGINQGPNLGTDVFYSGTVSAAMEGVLLGVPSFAVSLASFQYRDFLPTAELVLRLLGQKELYQIKGVLNINVPGIDEKDWKGFQFTRLGKAVYENVFESRIDPHGRKYFWQAGTLTFDQEDGTDLKAIQEGYVSLTPMHSDLTDFKYLAVLKGST